MSGGLARRQAHHASKMAAKHGHHTMTKAQRAAESAREKGKPHPHHKAK